MREDANLIAPLVRAGGTSEGIARFCDGPGRLHPDMVLATRNMTPAEARRCVNDGVAHTVSVPIGFTGFVTVVSKNSPFKAMSRIALARALTGDAGRWSDVDPSLPKVPVSVQGPAADPAIADGLFNILLAPGAQIRRDGAYTGHGANAELVVAKVSVVPWAVGILPYPQAVAHRDTLRMLVLDGVQPNPASIASRRYPASAPLILFIKADEIRVTPGLSELLGYFADGLASGGSFEQRGLVPLPATGRTAAAARLRALAVR
jgi:phosphate transport system substrate-binding protein